MKKLLSILLLTAIISCNQPARNCKDYKTGSFNTEFMLNKKKQITSFVRNDSIEIETYNGVTDTSTIRWINDCEYVLSKKNPKTLQEKKAIAIKILSTTQNSYTFEFGIVGSTQKQVSTATKN